MTGPIRRQTTFNYVDTLLSERLSNSRALDGTCGSLYEICSNDDLDKKRNEVQLFHRPPPVFYFAFFLSRVPAPPAVNLSGHQPELLLGTCLITNNETIELCICRHISFRRAANPKLPTIK